MDPITHTLAGVAIRQAGFNKKAAAIWIVIIASLLPDIDYLMRFWGADMLLRYHRGITHGIFAIFLAPMLIALLFKGKCGFLYSYTLAFLAYGLHIFFDFSNQYGTRIMSPLDWNQYSLDLTFIIEPWISIPLLASLIIGLMNKKSSQLIAVSALILISIVFGARYYLQGEARAFLKKNIDANIYKVYPIPGDFLTWSFLTKTQETTEVGIIDLFAKRVLVAETFKRTPNDPLIEVSRENKVVQNFLYFAKFPYAELIKQDGVSTVIWRDLAYSYMTGRRFSVKVLFDSRGNIKEAGFKI